MKRLLLILGRWSKPDLPPLPPTEAEEVTTGSGEVSPTHHHYHPLKQKKSLRGSGEVSQTNTHYHPLKQKKSLRGSGEVN